MKLPKRKSVTERSGVIEVDRITVDELGWVFREQPTDDFGIDAHLEIVDGDNATGRLIAIQIKTGASYFREENSEGYVFRGRIEHLNYWDNYSLPVIIVLCDRDKKLCIWESIDKSKVQVISEDTWKITVPKDKIFGGGSIRKLVELAGKQSKYERRFNSLVLEKAWMEEIKNGNRVVLEAEEWVNKTSGRGTVTLKVIDDNTGKETVVLDWPMAFFPMSSYEDVFPRLFPWAEFSIDEDFYEEYDEADFMIENATWDKEDERYIVFGSKAEYKSRLPKIRPYKNISGEVDCYRLELTLNELGEAFLLIDDYLRNGFKYNIFK